MEPSGATPLQPNRRSFERQLSQLNNQILEKQNERSEMEKELKDIRQQLEQLKKEKENAKKERNALSPQIKEMEHILHQKRQKISEFEKDMLFKNETELNRKLQHVKNIYNDRIFENARDEKVFVMQIDQLERNKRKFENYQSLIRERKEQEDKVGAFKKQLRTASHVFKRSRFKEDSCKKKKSNIIERLYGKKGMYDGLKHEVSSLERDKAQLIEEYNGCREAYKKWQQTNNNIRVDKAVPLSRNNSGSFASSLVNRFFSKRPSWNPKPPLKSRVDGESDVGSEDEFEPFVEEKQACQRLIYVLSELIEHADVEELNPFSLSAPSLDEVDTQGTTLRLQLPTSGTDSGGENESLAKLKRSPDLPPSPRQLSKKRSSRKLKRPNQSISHAARDLTAFDMVDVPPPVIYGDVPNILERLKDRLQFYTEQTLVPDSALIPFSTLTNDYTDADRMSFVYPSSESDRTNDSAWASFSLSEADSFTYSPEILSPVSTYSGRLSMGEPSFPSPSSPSTHFPSSSSPTLTSTTTSTARESEDPVLRAPISVNRSLSDGTGTNEGGTLTSTTTPNFSTPRTQVDEIVDLLGDNCVLGNPQSIQPISDEGIEDAGTASKDSSTNSSSVDPSVLKLRKRLQFANPTPECPPPDEKDADQMAPSSQPPSE